ncbi:hypothetical protein [Pasteuria penetrans]|uniref:hypothetical protein n=1 Tax=Pasteuria penetrans TaxID=86005 RepID=UPI0011EF4BF1|nr:hypothetical protein [Pasteuria penetrans]
MGGAEGLKGPAWIGRRTISPHNHHSGHTLCTVDLCGVRRAGSCESVEFGSVRAPVEMPGSLDVAWARSGVMEAKVN